MRKTFLTLLLLSLLLALAAPLITLWNHPLSPLLLHFHSHWLMPIACLVLPMRACRRGLDPYAAFFLPLVFFILAYIWLRLPLPPLVWLLSFFLSVLGAVIGQEARKRKTE